MKRLYKFIIALPLIISSCGQQFASTGQQGEAIVIGIATTSDGQPMPNQKIKVADHEYIPNSYVSRAAIIEIDSVMTDINGQFEFTVATGQTVTFSSQKGSSYFYVPDITVDETDKNLGTIPFSQGMAIKVYPWWESEGEDQYLLIQGTDWVITVSDDAIDDISLPIGEFDIIRFGSDDAFEYDNSGELDYIGDSASWEDDHSFFEMWNSAEINTNVTIVINNVSNGFIYEINWGDGSMVDTISIDSAKVDSAEIDTIAVDMINTRRVNHTYTEVNTYDVTVTEYEFSPIDTLTTTWIKRRSEKDSIKIIEKLDTLMKGANKDW